MCLEDKGVAHIAAHAKILEYVVVICYHDSDSGEEVKQ